MEEIQPLSEALLKKDIESCSALLDDIKSWVLDSTKQLQIIKSKIKEMEKSGSDSSKSNNFQYIDVKSMLLLNYCMSLQYYTLLKVQGKDLESHQIFERLAYLRLLIEKLKPLDKKIEYQIQKLLKSVISRGPEIKETKVRTKINLW